jgi:hypothetical protein
VAEPASWYVVEPGWEVVDRAGERVGEVREVVGDVDADIFDGVRLATAGGDERYVPADRVAWIETGRLQLDVSAAGLAAGDAVQPPGGGEYRPDPSSEL